MFSFFSSLAYFYPRSNYVCVSFDVQYVKEKFNQRKYRCTECLKLTEHFSFNWGDFIRVFFFIQQYIICRSSDSTGIDAVTTLALADLIHYSASSHPLSTFLAIFLTPYAILIIPFAEPSYSSRTMD
jgi:hypothetical protein